MKVLITGASGFVGGNFARLALERGFHVFAHYNNNPPALPPSRNLTTFQCDLRSTIPSWPSVDFVLHTATNANAPSVPATALIEGNVVLTKNLLAWMLDAGVSSCFFCSSVSVYGDVRVPILDEITAPINPSPYGMTKKLSEAMFFENADRIACLAVRLPCVLGPRARGTWLTKIVDQIRTQGFVTVYNPSSEFNNAVHVEDLFSLAMSLMRTGMSGFDAVTVSAGTTMTVMDLVTLLFEELGVRPDIRVVENGRSSFIISSEKAKSQYGYEPMPLDKMIRRYTKTLFEPVF